MSAELIVNTFWFISLFTAAAYITKKKYVGKKSFYMIEMIFKLSLSLSIFLIILSLYFMLTRS